MSIFGRVVGSASVGCALCLTLAVPTALSATGSVALAAQPTTVEVLADLMAGDDPALSLAQPSTSETGWLSEPPFNVPDSALVVNTPGTDDITLYPRIDPMRGELETVIVVSPESFFPFISGNSGHLLPIFAPTYDQSVAVAVDHILETMKGLENASDKPYVVYTGYSQGADAVIGAAEQGYADGLLDADSTQIVLVSDPRSPWGLKQWVADHSLVSVGSTLIGATPNGARNPADTGDDLQVTSVIIDGDPVANFQWVWYRPIASLVVNAAGALAIHSNLGPESYATLDQIQNKDVLYSQDGNTTYVIYHAEHPLTQVTEMAFGVFGIQLSGAQVDRLDQFNNWYYPLQQPSPERAAPIAPVTSTQPNLNTADYEASVALAASQDADTAEDPTPQRVDTTVEDTLADKIIRPKKGFADKRGPDKKELSSDASSGTDPDPAMNNPRRQLKNPDLKRVRPAAAHRPGKSDHAAGTTKGSLRGGKSFHKPSKQRSAPGGGADAA